jgi:hypothetical protein
MKLVVNARNFRFTSDISFFFVFEEKERERDVRWFVLVFGLLVCMCRKRDVYLFVLF